MEQKPQGMQAEPHWNAFLPRHNNEGPALVLLTTKSLNGDVSRWLCRLMVSQGANSQGCPGACVTLHPIYNKP